MMAPTYREMWPVYARQWDLMQIRPSRMGELQDFARRAEQGKPRYQEVETITGVPWWMIATTAERESGQDFSKSLAQGDPWNRRAIHIPRTGPFSSWKEAAVDALHQENLDLVHDWRLEKVLYYEERFNGWGYHNHGIPSPYLWGATSIQKSGKYVRDGVFDPNKWDTQLGAAAMLWAIMAIDPSVHPVRET